MDIHFKSKVIDVTGYATSRQTFVLFYRVCVSIQHGCQKGNGWRIVCLNGHKQMCVKAMEPQVRSGPVGALVVSTASSGYTI